MEPSDILLGFDPGGKGTFGWCVAGDGPHLPPRIISTGIAHSADSATRAAIAAVPASGTVRAAGIDAPLVWGRSGVRLVDGIVRRAITKAGAPYPYGTVQSVNSLRGACLAEGLLAALALRERYPGLPITEAHPKALRWLHPEALKVEAQTEHERDAVLGAFSAWAMARKADGWFDLYVHERNYFSPVEVPLGYFMPIDGTEQ